MKPEEKNTAPDAQKTNPDGKKENSGEPKVSKAQKKRLARLIRRHPEIIGREAGFRDLTELHGEWIREMVFGKGDYTLQAHRGSYKSSCLAVAISLMIIVWPTRNILFLRKADNDVSEMLGMVAKLLRTETFGRLSRTLMDRPLEILSQGANHLSTNLWTSPMGAEQLQGLGMGSSITGKHAYYVITDDICNLTDRLSRAERNTTKIRYDELQNIRNRGGRIINLGTPWHKDDVFTKMPNIHRYDCYTTGLLTDEKIDELRRSMAPSLFAANYELQHIASEDAFFETPPVFTDDADLLRDGIAHIDAAYGGKDYTAFTCARRRGDKLYLYGRLWHKHVETVVDECIGEAERLICAPILCENNGDKGFLYREIYSKGAYAREYPEHQNKVIKITSYLKKWWPNVVFLRGTDKEYINQIMDYTEQAEHDDAPDSAAVCCRFWDQRDWG